MISYLAQRANIFAELVVKEAKAKYYYFHI